LAKQKTAEQILTHLICSMYSENKHIFLRIKKHFDFQEELNWILTMYRANFDTIESFITAYTDGNLFLIKHFIDNMKYDVNHNRGDPLRIACTNNNFEVVKFLLSRNADITLRRYSASRRAYKTGNLNLIKLFIPYLYQCFDCQTHLQPHEICHHDSKKLKLNLNSRAITRFTKPKFPKVYDYLEFRANTTNLDFSEAHKINDNGGEVAILLSN
jgi:ankyrin repeat protein